MFFPSILAALWAVDEPSGSALPPEYWQHVWGGFVGALMFGLLSIALAVLGFKVFDWITPRMDIQKELTEKSNLAVAIVCAAIILGVCYVVASVVH